jgi:hypothetical protein
MGIGIGDRGPSLREKFLIDPSTELMSASFRIFAESIGLNRMLRGLVTS